MPGFFMPRGNVIRQYSFLQYYIVENFATFALLSGIMDFFQSRVPARKKIGFFLPCMWWTEIDKDVNYGRIAPVI
jgi:hypothetical protein